MNEISVYSHISFGVTFSKNRTLQPVAIGTSYATRVSLVLLVSNFNRVCEKQICLLCFASFGMYIYGSIHCVAAVVHDIFRGAWSALAELLHLRIDFISDHVTLTVGSQTCVMRNPNSNSEKIYFVF